MAVSPTYPGVYITETSSIPHVVTPATTNLTAVIGEFPQGPVNQAVLVTSWAQFQSAFGGLTTSSSLAAYAVWQFFLGGGIGAWIVRLATPGSAPAQATLALPQVSGASPAGPEGSLEIKALGPGAWANDLQIQLVQSGKPADPAGGHATFQVLPAATTPPKQNVAPLETVPNIALLEPDGKTPVSTAQIATTITGASQYVTASAGSAGASGTGPTPLQNGADGSWTTNAPANAFASAVTAALADGAPLDRIAPAVFNIMCIPDLAILDVGTQSEVFSLAYDYCEARRAFLLIDAPGPSAVSPTPAVTVDQVGVVAAPASGAEGESGGASAPSGMEVLTSTWATDFLSPDNGAAATYYPWVQITDPATGLPRYVPPSGTVAGVYAATDTSRGVWKAPAGVEALMRGVTGLADTTINDTVNGDLNILGINCLRTFPLYGSIVWGSRTLAGSDVAGSPFKYVPVRRLTDYIEQSLQQSLRWAVFEPNGPALWSSISLEVTAFMSGLFGAGAFAGASAATAYTVTCDASTTSPTDMLSGIVNVNVGFAPVDPAEFVMLNIQINAASAAS